MNAAAQFSTKIFLFQSKKKIIYFLPTISLQSDKTSPWLKNQLIILPVLLRTKERKKERFCKPPREWLEHKQRSQSTASMKSHSVRTESSFHLEPSYVPLSHGSPQSGGKCMTHPIPFNVQLRIWMCVPSSILGVFFPRKGKNRYDETTISPKY